jgi:transposase
VWSKGKPVRVKSTEKIKSNTFGFYALNGSSVCCFPEGSKKGDMCAFLDGVREANGLRTVVMVLDNSVIHRCRAVTEHATELDIILLFLPPYCPQYNPIELIWKSVNRCISRAFVLCREGMIATIEETFCRESAKLSYAAAWMEKFLCGIILNN